MRRRTISLVSVLGALAATAATAGSLDFWERSRGARGVTANFPTGTAQIADIDFDAGSVVGGGMAFGASEIDIRPTGSVSFTAFTCQLQGCAGNYEFTPGTQSQGGRLVLTDLDGAEKHGVYDLGTITFDGPQPPGAMPLVGCSYTGLDFVERTCSPFVLVSLPEPGPFSALLAGAALLAGLRAHRRTR